jgi:F-type H+-transporting ATPase subunit b
MPQLDISTFPSQVFWLIICFGILCLVMATAITPKIGVSLSKRQNKVDDDYETANNLLAEAQALQKQTTLLLTQERHASTQKIQQFVKEIQEHKREKLKNFDHQLTMESKQLEISLKQQAQAIMQNADDLITQVVLSAIEQLTPLSMNEKKIKAAYQKMETQNA